VAKDPWYKLYPEIWEADVKLQSCSLAAQGLLLKLMNMMHQSEKPGYLLIGSSAPTWAQVGRVGRVPYNTLCKYLKELLEKEVLVEEDGVLVCKRMVRDQAYRQQQSEYGKKGGNPKLVGETLKGRLIPRSKMLDVRDKKEIKIEGTIVPSSSRATPCPVDDVVGLYHKILPTMPQIRVKGEKLKARLTARWREHPDLSWWESYFSFVAESPFLCGKKTDWCASLFWITAPTNQEKILNNEYHRDQNGVSRKTAQNLEALKSWKEKE